MLLETAIIICIISGKFGHVSLAPKGVAGEKRGLSCAPRGWQIFHHSLTEVIH